MKRVTAFAVLLVVLAAPAWAGMDEGIAAYERGDYATALREFRVLAEQGNAGAQANLAVMFYFGRGVTQDYAEAATWYRKLAEQGPATGSPTVRVGSKLPVNAAPSPRPESGLKPKSPSRESTFAL